MCAYVGSYCSLLRPMGVIDQSVHGVGIGHREADYGSDGQFAQWFFVPIYFIDRQCRPAFWNSWSTTDDEIRDDDRPWGSIRYVNGKIYSVSIYAYDEGDLVVVGQLADFPHSLDYVRIKGPAFTDSGLVKLQQLTHLGHLELLETGVSRSGAQQIRQSLPNCQVSCLSVTAHGIEAY